MPYVAGSGAEFVKLGPGKIYFGPVGSTEPVTLSAALDAAWVYAGFTEEGSQFTITPTYENVEVAESLIPLVRVPTGQEQSLELALAEITAANLQRALNGATITASGSGATSIDKVEPLAFGSTETRTAVIWEASDASERWIYRKCLQTGALTVQRRKGATKATIALSFSLEVVSSAIRPWGAILKSTGTIT